MAGLFSSSLFLGCVFGAVFGQSAAYFDPGLSGQYLAFLLVGMGAVAAAIVGAPFTMVFLVLESTNDFPVTIGVLLTPWQLGQFGTVAAVFAIVSGAIIWLQLRMRARENALPLNSLMLGGSLYVVFLVYVLWSLLA